MATASTINDVVVGSSSNATFDNVINEPTMTVKIDYSSILAKSVLVSPTEKQFELLRRRLQERINDSRGETIYDIGTSEGM